MSYLSARINLSRAENLWRMRAEEEEGEQVWNLQQEKCTKPIFKKPTAQKRVSRVEQIVYDEKTAKLCSVQIRKAMVLFLLLNSSKRRGKNKKLKQIITIWTADKSEKKIAKCKAEKDWDKWTCNVWEL